ncbi:MAG: radical SAM protein [bacterium]
MIFINPPCFQGYRFPSIGMLYIAAHMRRSGMDVDYLDCNYHDDWRRRLDGLAEKHVYAGITANVLSIGPALEVARHLRRNHPGVRVVMGGPYPSVEYERLIPGYADVVVIGEGEETALELERGAPPAERVAGLAYGYGGVRTTPPRPLIKDLDAIPFPAWDLGDVSKYRLAHTRRSPVLPIITSRGCPFRCVFCGSAIVNRNRLRYRSPENVLEEIDEIYNRYGVREIHVWDDNFTLHPDRTKDLCERIVKRGYKGLLFSVPSGIKPDVGDDALFSTMARAGFYAVCIAVETGSQEIMDSVGKKVDLSKVRGVVKAARRAGILTNGFFMLGLPYDTEETMKKTIAFACSLPLDQALFFITIPFPGTKLHEIASVEGKILYHADGGFWEKGYFLGKACYEMPGFSAGALERMYRAANRRFYMRPRQLLRLIARGRVRTLRDVPYLLMKGLKVILKGRQF